MLAPPIANGVDDDLVRDTYVYLLGRALVVRQEQVDRAADGFAYNTLRFNPLGSAEFVNPNLDVAYLEAWFAVDDDSAVLLDVPAVEGRYYTAQLLDEWGEVIANVNEREMPTHPSGRFALVTPGSRADVPAGVPRLTLHGRKAKLLARVELQGDPEGAVGLQHAFAVQVVGRPVVADPPALPPFDNATLLGVELFEHAPAVLRSALDVSPVAARFQVAAHAVAAALAADPGERERLDAYLRGTVAPEFRRWALTGSAPYVDHWIGGGRIGTYGADVALRTVANYAGIWANTATEVVYFVATRDAEDEVLDGGRQYRLRFPPDALPGDAVAAYWSIILVGVPDYRVVPNALDRYNLNQYSPLVPDDDGGLTIAIGPEAPDDVATSNWLPSAAGKPFSLTFRSYVPVTARPFGTWGPPAVTARS